MLVLPNDGEKEEIFSSDTAVSMPMEERNFLIHIYPIRQPLSIALANYLTYFPANLRQYYTAVVQSIFLSSNLLHWQMLFLTQAISD
jgi:hypothetical protein